MQMLHEPVLSSNDKEEAKNLLTSLLADWLAAASLLRLFSLTREQKRRWNLWTRYY
jgi:hypothetical protein